MMDLDDVIDIDTPLDLAFAKYYLSEKLKK
jgi:CMP-N-acetylneuraminic acid synthetase